MVYKLSYCIFMNINENIRNKRKMLENLKGCTHNLIHMSAAHYSGLPKLIIFLNIDLNVQNERKMVIKLKGVPTKLLIS